MCLPIDCKKGYRYSNNVELDENLISKRHLNESLLVEMFCFQNHSIFTKIISVSKLKKI